MADVDIDPFGEHESRPEEPMDEHIPLTQEEDQLGNQSEVNKKHHSEGDKVKEIEC